MIEFSWENILWFGIAILVAYIAKELIAPARPKPAPKAPKPPRPPLREFTKEELRRCDGSDPSAALCIAIKGRIYDCSRGRSFYGPGGAYGIFAGHDASYALAKGSLEVADLDKAIDNLDASEKTTLHDWHQMYESKYELVGWLEGHPPIVQATAPAAATTTPTTPAAVPTSH